MSPCPRPVQPQEKVSEAARRMKECGAAMLPVQTPAGLIGMITDRDLALRIVAHEAGAPDARVGDVMSVGVLYCYDSEPLPGALRLLERSRSTHLLVLDQARQPVGVFSIADLVRRVGAEKLAGVLKQTKLRRGGSAAARRRAAE